MQTKKVDKTAVIVVVVIAVIVIGGFLVRGLSDMTRSSTPGISGNTAGNLYNYGLFCDDGERYYFSNYKDQGMLYSMSHDLKDFKLVTNDVARYINADEHYLFYSRMNNLKDESARSIFIFYSNGIFRIGKNGRNLKMLWNQPIGSLLLYDNELYYQYYMEGEELSTHKLSIDAKNDSYLFSDESVAVSLNDNKLYYAGVRKDRCLHAANIIDGTEVSSLNGGFFNPIATADGIYFIDVNNGYKLSFCLADGSDLRVIADKRCSTFNLSADGRKIYYQYDNGKESGLFEYDVDDASESRIKSGNYKWINIVGEHCFFYEFDESKVYRYTPSSGLYEFDPPVINK